MELILLITFQVDKDLHLLNDYDLPIKKQFEGLEIPQVLLWLDEKQSAKTSLRVTPYIADILKDAPSGVKLNSEFQNYVEIVRNAPKITPAILVTK